MSLTRLDLVTLPASTLPTMGAQTQADDAHLCGLAKTALADALHRLHAPQGVTVNLQTATARAVRAATLLKRASQSSHASARTRANGGQHE